MVKVTIPPPNSCPSPVPFELHTTPIADVDEILPVTQMPASGDVANLQTGAAFHLGALISAGGEGSIYNTELSDYVCKIYHRNKITRLRKSKIELMLSRKIVRTGICWPVELVTNTNGEFVGYLMPRAHGKTLQSQIFVKPKFQKELPNWTRADLVNVAGTFLDHIDFLHRLNIIVGDINPLNILITGDSTNVFLVDTDSFQIENFPCPVGTVTFTPSDIQNKSYSSFLRTKEHELFATATMIFMILMPGKPPYSQQGGGTPAENIKSRNFPYKFSNDGNQEISGVDAPQGPWQFIWSNFPYPVRQAFFKTFKENKPTTVDAWTSILVKYRDDLNRKLFSNDLFPVSFPIRDPVIACCAKCRSNYTASQRYLEKLKVQSRSPWCPACASKFRIQRLVNQSAKILMHSTASQQPVKVSTPQTPAPHTTRPSTAPSYAPRTPSKRYTQAPPTNRTVPGVPNKKPPDGIIVSILKFFFN